MNIRKRTLAGFAAVLSLAVLSTGAENKSHGEWPAYGHDPGGQRFSPLTAINRQNVQSLKIAWTFRTGDAYEPKNGRPTAFEATPLYIDGKLYIGTPLGRVIALDPLTGNQIWAYDAKIPRDKGYGDFANRGVSTWQSGKAPRRIFVATIDARLVALDAATGQPCADFGDNGIVNLRNGLRIAPRGFADYEETSPPAIVGNTIILGSGVADNGSVNQPSGEVRGFDAITGKLKWTFDPIPQDPKGTGADTWKNGSAQRTGAANAWSVIAADPQRNLVFLPVGSASPDFYGGERLGNNLFANSLVALRADTGERVWYFQTVHHDLWDYDIASPPILFDVHKNGKDHSRRRRRIENRALLHPESRNRRANFRRRRASGSGQRHSRRSRFPNTTVPRRTSCSFPARKTDRRHRMGSHRGRQKVVSGRSRQAPLGRRFHSTESARDPPAARQHRRHGVGRGRFRSHSPPVNHSDQQHGDRGLPDPTRRLRE